MAVSKSFFTVLNNVGFFPKDEISVIHRYWYSPTSLSGDRR